MASAVRYRPPKLLLRSDIDHGILKKIYTTLFIHRKKVFCTKLLLKKFWLPRSDETAEATSAVWYTVDHGSCFRCLRPPNTLWPRGSLCENEYWLSVPLKGYYSKNKYICKHCILTATRNVNIKGEKKSATVVSIRSRKPILTISDSIFSVNSKPYSKRH
jgi:hypothetical protein